MERTEILERLKGAVRTATNGRVKAEEVVLQARLREDLEIDSMDMVDLALACEDQFHVNVPDEEAIKLQTPGSTVADTIALLERLLCRA